MRTKLIETFWNAVYGLGVVTLSLTPRTPPKKSKFAETELYFANLRIFGSRFEDLGF